VKQVLQDRSGLTVVRDVPPPPCPPGSLLVRNAFSAISSGTEGARIALSKKSLLAKARERPDLARQVIDRARSEGIRSTHQAVKRKLGEPVAVGYSSAGEVLEVGGAVAGFDVGKAVACAGGGHANHAEIVSVPINLCARVPDGVPLQTASMAAIASIALHAIRLADVRVGEHVAVVGCGLVGQIAVRLLRAAGAEIVAIDIHAERTERARAAGASAAFVADGDVSRRVQEATGGQGVDAALVTAAATSSDPLITAAELARDRGTVVLVGDVPVDLPRSLLYEKELSFRVSRSYGPGRYDAAYEEKGLDYPIGYVRWTEKRNIEAILNLQASGRLDLEDLVEDVVPVEQAARAYERLAGPMKERPLGALLLSYGRETEATREPATLQLPAQKRLVAASTSRSPIRVGLIGPGSFASRVLVPALVRSGARLELAGGGSGPSAEAAMRGLGFARVAPSAAAVIGDENVDAVVVATRHGMHAELSAQALEAGKHVFCEKPLALSREELELVFAAAAEATGILAVGFNRRFSPLLRTLRDFLGGAADHLAASYRISAGRLDAGHWAHDLDEGGGRILGEVCHFVDSLRFLVGVDVEAVHATGYGAPGAPIRARDSVGVNLTFANGSIGTILYVADGSPAVPKERLEAYSADRTGILDDYRRLELLGPRRKRSVRSRRRDKGHEQEVDAFLRAVERGEPPIPLEELAGVSVATLAIVESLRTDRPVRLLPETPTGGSD
jgi:predicted dehydrogenase/threonine dehydrogenase-like Zn-dependent dehydrogenase